MTGAERRQTEKPDAGSHKTAEIVLSAFLPLLFYGLAAETALIVLELFGVCQVFGLLPGRRERLCF